ncbi:MAG: hypothetical protein QHC89_04770 [Bosea sp. (in: a-proteobacteria)]|nr:hypothetical protein [Bosea sp. (in: a-proteobacteria)]
MDGRTQAFAVDGPREAAGKPDGDLLEGHDLEALMTTTSSRQTSLLHG